MTPSTNVSFGSARAEIRPLLKLSVPLMIGLMAATLIGVVDTVMIAPLGTVPLAAAGITTAVLIILISALWGIVTVVGVQIATAEGAEDREEVTAHVKVGLVLGALAGAGAAVVMMGVYPLLGPLGQPAEVLEILLPYWVSMALWIVPFTMFFVLKTLFDGVGREWLGVGLSYLGVVINVPANYLFIHEFGLGVLGAGLASVLSQTVSLTAGLLVWRFSNRMSLFRAPVPLSWSRVYTHFKESLPLCLGYAGEGGAYAFMGVMVGWLGATALAAHQVANAVAGLAYVIPLGMSGAVSICVGQAIGGQHQERLRPILKAGLLIVTIWQCTVAAIFVFGGPYISASLSQDPEVVALATTLFLVLALMQIADGVQSTSLGALRGIMDSRVPTAITLVAYWPLALPAAYVIGFVLNEGAAGLWLGYTLGLAVAAVALPLRFWRKTE